MGDTYATSSSTGEAAVKTGVIKMVRAKIDPINLLRPRPAVKMYCRCACTNAPTPCRCHPNCYCMCTPDDPTMKKVFQVPIVIDPQG